MAVKITKIGELSEVIPGTSARIEKTRGKITLDDIDVCLRKAHEEGLWVVVLNVGGDLEDESENDSVIVHRWDTFDCPLCRSSTGAHVCPDCGFDLLKWKLEEGE